MWRRQLLVAAVVAWIAATLAACFNLDTAHALLWSGHPGSYFGYTVALRDLGDGTCRLVVGAPRGNSSYVTHHRLVEPGAVYYCNVQDSSCEQLALDFSGNVNHTLPNTFFKYQDKKDNAWIGGSISVQQTSNSPMVVCAPRWKNSIESGYYLMNGICYISKSHTRPDTEARIIYPLSDPYLRAFPPKPAPDVVQRIYYAYGEAGLSTHFTKNGMELLIGAPGVFDWAGTVAIYRNIGNGLKDVRIPNPFYTPTKQNPHDYFGYAVSSGVFFRRPKQISGTLYVSGAPRAGDLHGMVLVFSLPAREDRPLDVWVEKVGEQLGEYFGSALCVVDLNADGMDDLVVGAPRHSLREPGSNSLDEGRVYAFISQDQGRLEEVTGSDKIVGDGEHMANFGTSIAAIGDLNMDGYSDIAIGAPYGGLDERGVVYIYHGHRNGMNSKYSQRIIASDINRSINGFGVSISNGMDIDNNSYNDIAVGAYQSDEAVILRARPIVSVRAELASNLKTISINSSSFQVESCLSYSGKHVPSSLNVRIVMVVDSLLFRAYFPDDQDYNSNVHAEDVTLFSNNIMCKNFTVYIKSGQKDFWKPINIKLNYSLPDEDTMPKRTRRAAYEDFCKDCPVRDPSQSTTVLLRVPFATGCHSDDCRTDLRLYAELVSAVVPLVLGNQTTVAVVATVESGLDPAFLARVLIDVPVSVGLVKMPSSCHKDTSGSLLHLSCDIGNPLVSDAGPKNVTVELDVTNVPEDTQELVFNVTVTSTNYELKPDDNSKTLTLAVRTLSDIRMVGISNPDTLYFSKEFSSSDVIGEQECIHSYQVRNYGPSNVNSLEMSFRVPVAVTLADRTLVFNKLYQPKTLLNGQTFFCSASDYEFPGNSYIWSSVSSNDSNIDLSLLESHRRRRAVSDTLPHEGEALVNGTLYLNCSQSNTKCVTITCSDIGPFAFVQTSASVRLRMQVRTSQLVPVLGKVDVLKLSTSGSISYQRLPNSLQSPGEREKTLTTVFLAEAVGKGLEMWMLVLAIMVGLLLFLLLLLGLIKAGFFLRSKKEALQHLKTKMKYEDCDEYETL